MRPLALTIEGLTSFKTSQEVDLSELDLFVITGPTGSGKSSILDAITFAIFGNVPRVNAHELRDLISHGSSFMRVCLDFQVDDKHYRVARRMGKNSHQATLERIENGASVTEVEQGGIRVVNDRLEQIVGLDFKAFTKAVLLPQGTFHEFLTGDVGERRRILMRLLDLGRYEAAGQAARREATRLDAIIDERNSLIESNYADATQNRLRELERAANAAGERHEKVEQAKKDGKLIADGVAAADRTCGALTGNTGLIKDARADLEQLADAWPELEDEERGTDEGLERTEKTLAEAQETLEKARKELDATKERTGDASLLARLESAGTAYEREQGELARLNGELDGARKTAEDLAEALNRAKAAETEAREALNESAEARDRLEAEHRLAEAVLRCAQASARLATLGRELELARQEATNAGVEVGDARSRLRHLEQQHAAVALRAGLASGDHCPVCNLVIDVLPESDAELESLLEDARKAAHAANQLEQAAKEALVTLQTQRRAAAEGLEQAQVALPEHTKVPDEPNAAAALARANGALTEAQEALEQAESAVVAAGKAASEATTAARTADTKAEGITTHRQGAEERLHTALSTLTATFGERLPDNTLTAIAHRRDELNTAEHAEQQAAAATEAAQRARDEAERIRKGSAAHVATFDQKFMAGRTTARMACEAVRRLLDDAEFAAFPAEESERATLLTAWRSCCDKHLASARSAMDRLGKELRSAAAKLERLGANVGIDAGSDDPSEIAVSIEQAATSAHGVAVAAKKDVETLQTRIHERAKLEQVIIDDRRLSALHQTLARELRADHFIAFVLQESMNQLAAQASEELTRISDGRYTLVAEAGSFEVVDHHNADERRSVATLSGGETFLASLSLALALSAGLRELAGTTAAARLDAIFIDEGFGALDLETLDVVVDALERLREGDRMVGVITHVPTLAERIPAGLSVEKNGNSSCIVAR